MELLLIITVFLMVAFNSVQAGEVRCFCNLPVCVTSGYMCKSARGGCFSDLYDLQDVSKARHGCVELLESDRQGQCQNEAGSSAGHKRSLLLCCKSDMCNHVDNPEIKLRVNDSIQGLVHNATEAHRVHTAAADARISSTEVWFKAATIAVPICGALILFILIALAVKILRTDGLEARFMPKHDQHYTSKKVPLLHVQLQNETNTKLNFTAAGNNNFSGCNSFTTTQSVPNVNNANNTVNIHQCYTHYHNVDVRLQAPSESNKACCNHNERGGAIVGTHV